MVVTRGLYRFGICVVISLLAFALAHSPAFAEELLLIRNTLPVAKAEVRLSEEDLQTLPQVTIRTKTEFTDGVVEFVGPLARDAVALIDVGGATTAHLVAANDYALDIPLSDLMDYDVILAMQASGKRLSIRNKGPIWLMYPLDDHAELQDPVYNLRLIWQLVRMELR